MGKTFGEGSQQDGRRGVTGGLVGHFATCEVVRAVHSDDGLAGAGTAEHARGAIACAFSHTALLRVDVHAPLVEGAGLDDGAQGFGLHVVDVGEFQPGGCLAQAGEQTRVFRCGGVFGGDFLQVKRFAGLIDVVASNQGEHGFVLPLGAICKQRVQLGLGVQFLRARGQRWVDAQFVPELLRGVARKRFARNSGVRIDDLRNHTGALHRIGSSLLLRQLLCCLRRCLGLRLRFGNGLLGGFFDQGGDAVDGVDFEAQCGGVEAFGFEVAFVVGVDVDKHKVVRFFVLDLEQNSAELIVDAAGADALVHGVGQRLDLQRRVGRVRRELLQEVHRRFHQGAVEFEAAVEAERHHGCHSLPSSAAGIVCGFRLPG